MRFRVLEEHAVLGTEQVVWVENMSAEGTLELRGSVLASLVPESKDEDEPDLIAAERFAFERQAGNVQIHTYNDKSGESRTFKSGAEAMVDLSAGQLEDLAVHIMRISAFTKEAVATAQRFPNGTGEAGGAPDSPDGGEVQPAAE